jgi:hypothetical protein
MDVKLLAPEGRVLLQESSTITFQAPSGTMLRVTQGRVWVTQCRDGRDHILQPGDAFALNGHGKTAVHALAPSTVWLGPFYESPRRQPAPRDSGAAD